MIITPSGETIVIGNDDTSEDENGNQESEKNDSSSNLPDEGNEENELPGDDKQDDVITLPFVPLN